MSILIEKLRLKEQIYIRRELHGAHLLNRHRGSEGDRSLLSLYSDWNLFGFESI